MELVRKQIPPILKETAEIRELVPPLLHEVEQIRAQVPSILKESAEIRNQVPSIVDGVNNASTAIELASKEVAASRPVVADLTTQIRITTNAIPPLLDHAEQIVREAEGIGEKAGRSAVTGVVTGVVTSPFALVGDIGRSLTGNDTKVSKHYSDKDYELIEKSVLTLCNGHDIGTSMDWDNPESSSHGTVTLKSIHNTSREQCRTLTVKNMKGGVLLGENEITACRHGSGTWHITKEEHP